FFRRARLRRVPARGDQRPVSPRRRAHPNLPHDRSLGGPWMSPATHTGHLGILIVLRTETPSAASSMQRGSVRHHSVAGLAVVDRSGWLLTTCGARGARREIPIDRTTRATPSPANARGVLEIVSPSQTRATPIETSGSTAVMMARTGEIGVPAGPQLSCPAQAGVICRSNAREGRRPLDARATRGMG